ncbi:MAG: 1,3-beta-glucanase [Clostridium butyricum]|nr:1,3-beta-glucanase [Clostridium butyricum]
MFSLTKKIKLPKIIFSFTIVSIIMLCVAVILRPHITNAASESISKPNSDNNTATPSSISQLKVIGSQLCDSNDKPIQLKGMSSHGLQWYGNYMNYNSMKYLRDNWGINVVRAAMYTDQDGYISNPKAAKEKVKEIVQSAIDLKMYVIIDWHILYDNDPNTYKIQAKSFFEEMAKLYGNYPNIIYEICNEPNGNITWSDNIKPYAEYIIPSIRAIDPDNIIIVGTSTWSQDVDIAASDPLSYSNIMYACHFYAGTHGKFLRDKIDIAISKNLAVFVSEWGTSDASGNNGPYIDEAQTWIDYMDNKKISWCNWSLCDKDETSAALKPGANTTGGWTDSNLTPSGLFVKKNISTSNTTTSKDSISNSTVSNAHDTVNNVKISNSHIEVSYEIINDWDSGATINITIKNNGTTSINNWTLSWTQPENQTISQMWNGAYSKNNSTIFVKNLDYNNTIPANGGTQTFGFNINYSGANTIPANFKLNNTLCQVK